jgi:hypothetical protein
LGQQPPFGQGLVSQACTTEITENTENNKIWILTKARSHEEKSGEATSSSKKNVSLISVDQKLEVLKAGSSVPEIAAIGTLQWRFFFQDRSDAGIHHFDDTGCDRRGWG